MFCKGNFTVMTITLDLIYNFLLCLSSRINQMKYRRNNAFNIITLRRCMFRTFSYTST